MAAVCFCKGQKMKMKFFAPVSGVYRIACTATKRVYIGKSDNINHRLHVHTSYLINGNHPCEQMQKDFDQYGIGAFDIEIIIRCPPHETGNYERTLTFALFMEGIDLYNDTKSQRAMNTDYFFEKIKPQIEEVIDYPLLFAPS
jgi:hypothetical protein